MNHTDREMLELAAKAAGWTVVRWTDDDTALLLEGVQQPFNALCENPHSDYMGDAMRLAITTGLLGSPKHVIDWVYALGGDDQYADTCRAIVTAAAELGKAGGKR